MQSVWQSDEGQYEVAWDGDMTNRRPSSNNLQPSPNPGCGRERRWAPEANHLSRAETSGAGAGFGSRRGSGNILANEAANVDRGTSIRSVMTLPPYSSMASTMSRF